VVDWLSFIPSVVMGGLFGVTYVRLRNLQVIARHDQKVFQDHVLELEARLHVAETILQQTQQELDKALNARKGVTGTPGPMGPMGPPGKSFTAEEIKTLLDDMLFRGQPIKAATAFVIQEEP